MLWLWLTNLGSGAVCGAILPAGLIICGIVACYLIALARGRLLENWPIPRSPCLLLIIILLLGFPLGTILQGSFFQRVTEFCVVVYLIPASLVIYGITALVCWARGQRIPPIKLVALLFAACIPALCLSHVTGTAIYQWKIEAVHAYVARAVPMLDGIKARTGSYPIALPVAILGQPPCLLRTQDAYTASNDEFRFWYVDPTKIFSDGLVFNSTTRTWQYEDD